MKAQNAKSFLQKEIKDSIMHDQSIQDPNQKQATISQRSIVQLANEKWKTMTDAERAEFSDKARDDKARFKLEMKLYNQNLLNQQNQPMVMTAVKDEQESSSYEDESSQNSHNDGRDSKPKSGKPRLKKDYLKKQEQPQHNEMMKEDE
jgi:hypothetical protein